MAAFAGRARRAGFGLTLTPVFEDARLFRRGIGGQSDVVNKEMYEFTDRSHRPLALRPEGTAPIVRAFVQHHPPVPWKAWYVTPAFRYEEPQAGRYRQHHQLGVEVLGTEDPDVDVEVIALAARFYTDLGLRRIDLAVNSMGCAEDRPRYVAALGRYLSERAGELCDEHRARFEVNPLRVLDCKQPRVPRRHRGRPPPGRLPRRRLRRPPGPGAPGPRRPRDRAPARSPSRARSRLLHADHLRVRGHRPRSPLRTRWAAAGATTDWPRPSAGHPPRGSVSGSASSGCCWRATPKGRSPSLRRRPWRFVIDLTGGEEARDLVDELRRAGLAALRAYDGRSAKSQMKQADKSGARFAVIIGAEERATGVVTLRPLRDGGRAADGAAPRDRGPVVAAVGRGRRPMTRSRRRPRRPRQRQR